MKVVRRRLRLRSAVRRIAVKFFGIASVQFSRRLGRGAISRELFPEKQNIAMSRHRHSFST